MGQIIHPDNYEFKGPWLLDRNAFVELETILTTINDSLQKSMEIEIKESIKLAKENLSDDELRMAIEKEKTRYQFEKVTNLVHLKSKEQTKLAGKTLNDVLKDKNLSSFSPREFHTTIQRGLGNKFSIDINKYSNRLSYELICYDQEINNDLKDLIEQWVEKNKPSIYVSFWSNWGDVLKVILPMFIGILAILAFTSTESESIDPLKSEAHALIKKGIDNSNINRAIELILKIESEYKPETFVPTIEKPNPIFLKLFIFVSMLLVFSFIQPKTTIGLGKRKGILQFYKVWIKFVTITIPTLLLLGPFLSKIQEWWTN